MKIGVFDSGVGGLTVLSAIRERFPKIDLIYLGDTARVPYGNKSPETVIRYSRECAGFLMDRDIDILVVACNTASSYAIETLKEECQIPIVGVVEPGVREAVSVTKGKVGVIGTSATINSGSYQEKLKLYGIQTFSKACPLFVPLVEEGILNGPIAKSIVEMYLKDIKDKGIDTLILGCTHYPLLKETIETFMEAVFVVDSSRAVARELDSLVQNTGGGKTRLFFTDKSQNLNKMIELIMGECIEPEIVKGGMQRV